MSITIIKPEFIDQIKQNDALKLQLAEKHGVRITSVDRWLRENSVMLTTYDSLEILKGAFSVDSSEELLEGLSVAQV